MKIVRISKPLTKDLAYRILSDNEDVEEIIIPKSCMRRTSKRVINVLKEMGIEINVSYKRGRPKTSEDVIKKIHMMRKRGYSAKMISTELKVPLRTVYHILKTRPSP